MLKHWKFISVSPAGARVFRHINRDVLIYFYPSRIVLYRDFTLDVLPVSAQTIIEKFLESSK